MWFGGEDRFHYLGSGGTDRGGPVNQARRSPLQMGLMTLRAVLGIGRMSISSAAAQMRSHPHAALKDLYRGCRQTGFQQLSCQLVRHAVVMPVHFDVVIQIGAYVFPLGDLVALPRWGLQGRPVQVGKQRSPCPVPFTEGAMIQTSQQSVDRLI